MFTNRVVLVAVSLAVFPVVAQARQAASPYSPVPPYSQTSPYPQAPAGYSPPPAYYPAPPVQAAPAVVLLAPEQLDGLTGPVALYPDPLLAQVLAAATTPLDVVGAAQWSRQYPSVTEDQINDQPWAPAVKVLLHYPTVLESMADRVAWTQQLGAAFTYQPADVMASVQRLRAEAQLAGSLYTTQQQQVFVDAGAIRILPPSPEVVYVPTYDPTIVYVRGARPAPIRFSAGLTMGGWLDLDFDWGTRSVYTGARWNDVHVIRDHVFERRGPAARWAPDPRRVVVAPRSDRRPDVRPDQRPNLRDDHPPDVHDDHRGFDPNPHRDPGPDERRGNDSLHGRDAGRDAGRSTGHDVTPPRGPDRAPARAPDRGAGHGSDGAADRGHRP